MVKNNNEDMRFAQTVFVRYLSSENDSLQQNSWNINLKEIQWLLLDWKSTAATK